MLSLGHTPLMAPRLLASFRTGLVLDYINGNSVRVDSSCPVVVLLVMDKIAS